VGDVVGARVTWPLAGPHSTVPALSIRVSIDRPFVSVCLWIRPWAGWMAGRPPRTAQAQRGTRKVTKIVLGEEKT
jgi:hypothetical protein